MKKLLLVLLSCSVIFCSCNNQAQYKYRKFNGAVTWTQLDGKFDIGDSVEIDQNIVILLDKKNN